MPGLRARHRDQEGTSTSLQHCQHVPWPEALAGTREATAVLPRGSEHRLQTTAGQQAVPQAWYGLRQEKQRQYAGCLTVTAGGLASVTEIAFGTQGALARGGERVDGGEGSAGVGGRPRTATTVSNCCLPWLLSSTLACTTQ